MYLALNIAQMASGGHSRTTIEEMQQPMKKPYAKH
jgi:hypothetical protein